MDAATLPPTWKTRSYGWDAARPDLRELVSLPGIEIIQRMIDGRLPAPSIAATIGMGPVEVEEGRVVFEGRPGDHLLNPLGGIHGGFAATLLDSVLGCAVHTTLAPGFTYGTVELKVNYVRGLSHKSGPVLAEGKVIHVGRSIATAEARLYGKEDGKLYAHGSTTCFIQPVGGPPEA
ncbi:MAG TPA: PaaI family thioesterase [Azospirillaceae bacterium]|nr:PaaI family thioesterase [Azospirillaceae bacterium]